MKRTLLLTFILSLSLLRAFGEEHKRVALVFDDGPTPAQATRLLAILEEEGIHVTFAQVATTMEANTATSLMTLAKGHEIVNHSHDHLNVDDLDDAQLHHEIVDAQAKMTELLGVAPKWYWPPFLKINDRIKDTVKEAGIQIYQQSKIVVSKDYDNSVDADEIERLATTDVIDGSVILFHEWRKETVDRLPSILKTLRAQNCQFFTFSELHEKRKAQL